MPQLGPDKAFIFRITHVDNIAWIIKHGLHCRSSPTQDLNFVQIGNPELIDKRENLRVPIGLRPFSDYVPFYFTPWSIMAYKIKSGHGGIKQRGNHEIAVIVSSLHKLSEMRRTFVFTDGHAVAKETDWFEDLLELDKIAWEQLRRRDFKGDPEQPQKLNRYQAEAMVHKHVPVEAILGIACCDPATGAKLEACCESAKVSVPIKVLPSWYF